MALAAARLPPPARRPALRLVVSLSPAAPGRRAESERKPRAPRATLGRAARRGKDLAAGRSRVGQRESGNGRGAAGALLERLPAGEAGVEVVPERDPLFALTPTQAHDLAVVEAMEIDQALAQVLEHAADALKLLHG